MSRKRNLQRNKQQHMQKSNRQQQAEEVNPATGLRNDEIAIGYDPENPGEIKSYVLPDGKVLKPGDDDIPSGIMSVVDPDLFITTQEQQQVPRSTLAFRLGEMLLVAENLFGRRDCQYTFLGFEFTNRAPHIQFEGYKAMTTQLSQGTLFEPMSAYAEMAHECIHLLSPCPTRPVTILEEGMAEVFAYIYMRDTMKYEISERESGSAYHEAAYLVSILMEINPYGIKQMREEEPTISLITKSLIWKHYPMLEEGIAARLARTFVKDGCDDPDILAWYGRENDAYEQSQAVTV